MAPKITVHWLADSRSQRVLFLLEEVRAPRVSPFTPHPRSLPTPHCSSLP